MRVLGYDFCVRILSGNGVKDKETGTNKQKITPGTVNN